MASKPPVIPMITFTDYLLTSGAKRMALVERQVNQLGDAYNPGKDFYRPMLVALKEGIQFDTATAALDRAVLRARPTAAPHFKAVANGLAKYLRGAGDPDLTTVGRWDWAQPNLTVRINPDFALTWPNGRRTEVVKVYFKETPLTQFTAGALLRLMGYAVDHLGTRGAPAILDARRGKMWTRSNTRKNLDQFLQSEALAYGALWMGLASA